MNVLGISEGFHDAGVCLLVNKRIHFASHSERHSRIKNDRWSHSKQYPIIPERKPHVVAYYEKPFCKNLRRQINAINPGQVKRSRSKRLFVLQ